MNKTLLATTAAVFGAFVSHGAMAWKLDSDGSVVSYASTKNGEVVEPNVFTGLTGEVSDEGAATLEIAMASLETFIDIRNERMREFVLNVADYPVATLSADLDMATFAALAPGDVVESTFEVMISASGAETSYEATALVTRAADNRVLVASKAPIVVYAEDFGYLDGLAKLQEIAGLDSITPIVPVSFSLQFMK